MTGFPQFLAALLLKLVPDSPERNSRQQSYGQHGGQHEKLQDSPSQFAAQECGFDLHEFILGLEVSSQPHVTAILRADNVVLTLLRRDRPDALAVGPHAVKVVIRIQWNEEPVIAV